MYWLEDRSVPFATFLVIIQNHYHPDADGEAFDELVELARSGRGGERMATFKAELARLVTGDREGLRPHAISIASGYDEWATDEEFLAWLWTELYPAESLFGEPGCAAGASPA